MQIQLINDMYALLRAINYFLTNITQKRFTERQNIHDLGLTAHAHCSCSRWDS